MVSQAMPFGAAYAKIKTKTVRMEERNIYCGAYFTKVLLDKLVGFFSTPCRLA